MTYRGYKSWRPNSRRNRRARGRAKAGTQGTSGNSILTDRTFLALMGGFFLLLILVVLAVVLL
jgi:hypothetical protein